MGAARRRWAGLVGSLAVVLGLGLVAGCAGSGGGSGDPATDPPTTTAPGTGGGTAPAGERPEEAASSSALVSPDQIPPGREIAEGGGGPVQYTFREEWRRALVEAQAWRPGAFLVSATGRYINDEGVPTEWRLSFIDAPTGADADAVLFVVVDPWGGISQTEEVTESVSSRVSEFDRLVPADVLDSDDVVALGREALGSTYNLAQAQDPYASVGFSVRDGSGPYWRYGFFYPPTAEYVSVPLDALTGAIVPEPAPS